MGARTRRHSKIHHLPENVRAEVNQLLLEPNVKYEDIAAHLKAKGIAISKSAVGRYGMEFLNKVRDLRQVEDKARELLSGEGSDLMVLEEAVAKLVSEKLLSLLIKGTLDPTKHAKLVGEFAKLQASSVRREQLKAALREKVKGLAEKVEKTMKGKVDSATVRKVVREIYGLQV